MNATVLIADHDFRIADATRRCLEAHGCDAVTATNGLQCLEQFMRIEPTVAVLDPDMQWGGGDGVLEWLIEQKLRMEPLIVVTEGPGCGHILDRLQPWVDLRIHRPESLPELQFFVTQLETVALWSKMIRGDSLSASEMRASFEAPAHVKRVRDKSG